MNKNEYHNWEKKINSIKAYNNKLLKEFEVWLKDKNLKPNTINSHITNIDFYINEFLLRYDTIKASDGATEIGTFLGDFFIRKTSWASKYTIKENIASLKKFYSFMTEIGKTPKEDLNEMINIIKGETEDWIMEVETYWDNIEEL